MVIIFPINPWALLQSDTGRTEDRVHEIPGARPPPCQQMRPRLPCSLSWPLPFLPPTPPKARRAPPAPPPHQLAASTSLTSTRALGQPGPARQGLSAGVTPMESPRVPARSASVGDGPVAE